MYKQKPYGSWSSRKKDQNIDKILTFSHYILRKKEREKVERKRKKEKDRGRGKNVIEKK